LPQALDAYRVVVHTCCKWKERIPQNPKQTMFKQFRKIISVLLITAFTGSSLYIPQARAGEMVLPVMPVPGTRVDLSPVFMPAHLKGITINPNNGLEFDFLIHKGDGGLDESQKQEEYNKLIKYFLASLTIPEQDQWVNLSPFENNRIIENNFGKTEMGRDLLSQDYLLKQITSSLMYPESGLGKKFWDKVYERAYKEYGSTASIPVNTFNKVWIVPDEALVYESGNTAYVLKSHLKVMLEEDYLSKQKHSENTETKTLGVTSTIVREVLLPELEKEVNEGKNFAMLRQIYSGMILATWYKKALKESLLGKIYADKAKVSGVNQDDPKANEEIYQKYLTAFKKGVYNYIKEDTDKYTNQIIPRKYFAGGFNPAMSSAIRVLNANDAIDSAMIGAEGLNSAVLERASANLVLERPKNPLMLPNGGEIIKKTIEVETGLRKGSTPVKEDIVVKLFKETDDKVRIELFRGSFSVARGIGKLDNPRTGFSYLSAFVELHLPKSAKSIEDLKAIVFENDDQVTWAVNRAMVSENDVKVKVGDKTISVQSTDLRPYSDRISISPDVLSLIDNWDGKAIERLLQVIPLEAMHTEKESIDLELASQTVYSAPIRMDIVLNNENQVTARINVVQGSVIASRDTVIDINEIASPSRQLVRKSIINVKKMPLKYLAVGASVILFTAAAGTAVWYQLENNQKANSIPASYELRPFRINTEQGYVMVSVKNSEIIVKEYQKVNNKEIIVNDYKIKNQDDLPSFIRTPFLEKKNANRAMTASSSFGEMYQEALREYAEASKLDDEKKVKELSAKTNLMLLKEYNALRFDDKGQPKLDIGEVKELLLAQMKHVLDLNVPHAEKRAESFIMLIQSLKIGMLTDESVAYSLASNIPAESPNLAMVVDQTTKNKIKQELALNNLGKHVPEFNKPMMGYTDVVKTLAAIIAELPEAAISRQKIESLKNEIDVKYIEEARHFVITLILPQLSMEAQKHIFESAKTIPDILTAFDKIVALLREKRRLSTQDMQIITMAKALIDNPVPVINTRNPFRRTSAALPGETGRDRDRAMSVGYLESVSTTSKVILAALALGGAGWVITNVFQSVSQSALNSTMAQKELFDELQSVRTQKGTFTYRAPGASTDGAMKVNEVGGIDLNAANLDLQIKRDGNGVPLPINQQDMQKLNGIEGFIPVIIQITPVNTLPILSELQQKLLANT
jgi:hypothetical protein